MKVIIVEDRTAAGKKAFELLKKSLDAGARTLGLATGSTPLGLYREMIDSNLDFSNLVAINLDEYVGLPAEHEQSYHYFMEKELFSHKPFRLTFVPNGTATDLHEETIRYEKILEQYPIDFQVLGLGQNGHIGFNEPGTSFEEKTHVVDLTNSTIQANARFFDDESQVPKQAITMGIASILKAKKIIVIAFGKEKARAVQEAINGPVTPELPASILQTHPDVTFIVNQEAAQFLESAD